MKHPRLTVLGSVLLGGVLTLGVLRLTQGPTSTTPILIAVPGNCPGLLDHARPLGTCEANLGNTVGALQEAQAMGGNLVVSDGQHYQVFRKE